MAEKAVKDDLTEVESMPTAEDFKPFNEATNGTPNYLRNDSVDRPKLQMLEFEYPGIGEDGRSMMERSLRRHAALTVDKVDGGRASVGGVTSEKKESECIKLESQDDDGRPDDHDNSFAAKVTRFRMFEQYAADLRGRLRDHNTAVLKAFEDDEAFAREAVRLVGFQREEGKLREAATAAWAGTAKAKRAISAYSTLLETQLLGFLDESAGKNKIINERMKDYAVIDKDFVHYVVKLAELQTAKSVDTKRLTRNKEKHADMKNRLTQIEKELVDFFNEVEKRREELVFRKFLTWQKAQHDYLPILARSFGVNDRLHEEEGGDTVSCPIQGLHRDAFFFVDQEGGCGGNGKATASEVSWRTSMKHRLKFGAAADYTAADAQMEKEFQVESAFYAEFEASIPVMQNKALSFSQELVTSMRTRVAVDKNFLAICGLPRGGDDVSRRQTDFERFKVFDKDQVTAEMVYEEVADRLSADSQVEDELVDFLASYETSVIKPLGDVGCLLQQPTVMGMAKERPTLVASANHYSTNIRDLEKSLAEAMKAPSEKKDKLVETVQKKIDGKTAKHDTEIKKLADLTAQLIKTFASIEARCSLTVSETCAAAFALKSYVSVVISNGASTALNAPHQLVFRTSQFSGSCSGWMSNRTRTSLTKTGASNLTVGLLPSRKELLRHGVGINGLPLRLPALRFEQAVSAQVVIRRLLCSHRYQHQRLAAILVQSIVRSYVARREFAKDKSRVVVVQSFARQRLACTYVQQLNCGALVLQELWFGLLARRILIASKASVIRIQACARAVVTRHGRAARVVSSRQFNLVWKQSQRRVHKQSVHFTNGRVLAMMSTAAFLHMIQLRRGLFVRHKAAAGIQALARKLICQRQHAIKAFSAIQLHSFGRMVLGIRHLKEMKHDVLVLAEEERRRLEEEYVAAAAAVAERSRLEQEARLLEEAEKVRLRKEEEAEVTRLKNEAEAEKFRFKKEAEAEEARLKKEAEEKDIFEKGVGKYLGGCSSGDMSAIAGGDSMKRIILLLEKQGNDLAEALLDLKETTAERDTLTTELDTARDRILVLDKEGFRMKMRYQEQRGINAQLMLEIQALKGNIQVCCRIRPLSDTERGQGDQAAVELVSEKEVAVVNCHTNSWDLFGFDQVWAGNSTQDQIFEQVEALALSVVDGFNACICCYGQTGSGKTFTVSGLPREGKPGISFQTMDKVFETLELKVKTAATNREALEREQLKLFSSGLGSDRHKETSRPPPPTGSGSKITSFEWRAEVSMLEIYNEEVWCLLHNSSEPHPPTIAHPQHAKLNIKQGSNGLMTVPGLLTVPVSDTEGVLDAFERGNATRSVAATAMNETSSRSHMVLMVDITTRVNEGTEQTGRLYLVDLAGSERVAKSKVTGQALKEAQGINKSLSALGDVMEALDKRHAHVPYRNSKLTFLLQSALGGHARCMFIFNASPTDSNSDETRSTFKFASRMRNISLGAAKKNVAEGNSSIGMTDGVKGALAKEKSNSKQASREASAEILALKKELEEVRERACRQKRGSSDSNKGLLLLGAGEASSATSLASNQEEETVNDYFGSEPTSEENDNDDDDGDDFALDELVSRSSIIAHCSGSGAGIASASSSLLSSSPSPPSSPELPYSSRIRARPELLDLGGRRGGGDESGGGSGGRSGGRIRAGKGRGGGGRVGAVSRTRPRSTPNRPVGSLVSTRPRMSGGSAMPSDADTEVERDGSLPSRSFSPSSSSRPVSVRARSTPRNSASSTDLLSSSRSSVHKGSGI